VYRFANPGLRARVRGQDWFLHDKGLIGADLEVGWGTRVRVYSLHLFPFFEFGVGDADVHVSRMWRELWQYVDQLSGSAGVILAGDYNHTGRAGAAKEWSEHPWTFCVPQGMTTTRIGLSLDDIAINWTAPPDFVTVRDTFSDHHLVIAGLPHAGLPGGRHRRVAQSKFPVR